MGEHLKAISGARGLEIAWGRRFWLRSVSDLKVGGDFSVTVSRDVAVNLTVELRQILNDLGLADNVQIQDA